METHGLDPWRLVSAIIGLSHACWSVHHRYDGQNVMPLVKALWDQALADPTGRPDLKRQSKVACLMEHIPAYYFQYYYFRDEVLAELQSAPLTHAGIIHFQVPSYIAHYPEQVKAARPDPDPTRSRGDIAELELAVDVLVTILSDENCFLPCNVPDIGAIPNFPFERVVEMPCLVNRHGAHSLVQSELPRRAAGLVEMLGAYQALAAEAARPGVGADGIRALASNLLVLDLPKALAIYDDLAAVQRAYRSERLL